MSCRADVLDCSQNGRGLTTLGARSLCAGSGAARSQLVVGLGMYIARGTIYIYI